MTGRLIVIDTVEPPLTACVTSVPVWFRSKERPRNGILGFSRARNWTRAIFCAAFLAFAPKPQGNASLATQATIGYLSTTATFNMADSPSIDSCLNVSTTITSLLLFKPLYNGLFLLSPSWPLWRGSTVCERGINFNGRLGCVAGAWK